MSRVAHVTGQPLSNTLTCSLRFDNIAHCKQWLRGKCRRKQLAKTTEASDDAGKQEYKAVCTLTLGNPTADQLQAALSCGC